MTDQEILDALGTEPLEPNPVSFGYIVGGILNALAMAFLFIAYLGFIVAIGFLLYYYLVDYSFWATVDNTPGLIFGVVLQTTLLLACLVLILFLLKPIFARNEENEFSQKLDPEEESLLFSFVARLATLMNVSPPEQIRMLEDVNAVVSIERVSKLPFGNRQRVLAIGLPLFYGLSLPQFSGVLAHELGHFSQQPLRFFPRMVNFIYEWFLHAIHQREAWAKFLAKAGQKRGCGVAIVVLVTQLVIWLACGVLWLFLKLGQLFSFVLLRQMEYDADRWHARICGCGNFQAGHEKIAIMKLLWDQVADRIKPYVDDGILINDLPKFVVGESERIAPKERDATLQTVLPKSELMDVHPSIAARIETVQKKLGPSYPGQVQLELPASRLLRDMEATSQDFTKNLYQRLLGEEITEFKFCSAEAIFGHEEKVSQAARDWASFSLSQYQPIRFLPLDTTLLQDSASSEDAAPALKEAREVITETYRSYIEFLDEYDDNDDLWNQAFYAQNLYAASIAFTGEIGPHKIKTSQEAKAVEESALADRERLTKNLLPFEIAIKDRFGAAILILGDPRVSSEVKKLLEIYQTLAENEESTLALRNRLNSILGFYAMEFICSSPQKFRKRTQWLEDDSRRILKTLLHELQEVPYPFADSKKESFLSWAAIDDLPQAGNIVSLMRNMGRFLTAESDLRLQLLGRLAAIAMQVEESLGLPPLGEVVESRDEAIS